MKDEHKYLSPDYFTSFTCKMGACRKACCVGWPISFSVNDYFLLMGRECSAEMRSRIDRGVRIAITPTQDSYAQAVPRYDGDCAMRLEDGRCAIHAELGEDVLPNVCRLYPRGVRLQPAPECSLANSCEAVLELLFVQESPIVFEERALNITPPKPAKRLVNFPTMNREQDIRLCLIRCLQDRTESFQMRFLHLGYTLMHLEEILKAQDEKRLDTLLTERTEAPRVEACLKDGFDITRQLILSLDKRSNSIKGFGEEALSYYGDDDNAYTRYIEAAQSLERRFPNHQVFFEHMLVNHMFFEQFPFQDRPDTLWHEFIAIVLFTPSYVL